MKNLEYYFERKNKKLKSAQIKRTYLSSGNNFNIKNDEKSWELQTPDQMYMKLLDRVYSALRQIDPSLTLKPKKKKFPPVQVVREGKSKTVLVNFGEYVNKMNRDYEHVKHVSLL
eukprot:gnl/TRDRNA2_/TRDRNA2_176338_c0_seq4.p1 gnl/TRDRNA2_/TRDRNA2_176338_c0~~gnl/TRDRNA2_/TRDRNA2_176338_c0_seq4.p1  ORF type:complete len:115 (+),score=6.96 gnl/TRDRNA2_/TRDRNA2_176338_c0_seq4:230-574(+)